ncbi:MAG TPA: hypothetical protein VFL85_03220, partial [Candidatus Saccharimonadales bacterium]|nr:hypothetical protein [Candidatus Saccharimonadales bacterium]
QTSTKGSGFVSLSKADKQTITDTTARINQSNTRISKIDDTIAKLTSSTKEKDVTQLRDLMRERSSLVKVVNEDTSSLDKFKQALYGDSGKGAKVDNPKPFNGVLDTTETKALPAPSGASTAANGATVNASKSFAVQSDAERSLVEQLSKLDKQISRTIAKDGTTKSPAKAKALLEERKMVAQQLEKERDTIHQSMLDRAKGALAGEQPTQKTIAEASVNMPEPSIELPVAKPDTKATAETVVKEYADALKQMDDGMTGGQMVPDGSGGYIRTSEHSPFYSKYFKENGRAPSKQAWREEARQQLENGKADSYVQKMYNDMQDPEIASLLTQGEGYFAPTPKGFAVLRDAPDNLATVNTAKTTSKQAQDTIAKKAFVGPGARAVEETLPADKSAVEMGAENVAQELERWDESLKSINDNYSKARNALSQSAVKRDARKWSWLSHYSDVLGTVGRYLGKTGTDITYKFAEGAKKASDIQDLALDDLKNAQKALKQAAKSDVGKGDAQARVYAALEDRTNAAQYLTTDAEKKMYESSVKILDNFKKLLEEHGIPTIGENYSPRAIVRDALTQPEKLFDQMRSSFGKDVDSKFLKPRYAEVPDDQINRHIVEMLPSYVSSVAKQLAYKDAIDFAEQMLPQVNAAYLTNTADLQMGKKYLGTLMKQLLEPKQVGGYEKFMNKVLGTTYQSQLAFSPRFALQNMTQRWMANSQVSKEAIKLAKSMDKADVDALRKSIVTGDNPIMESIGVTPESVGNNKGFMSKFEFGHIAERGNIHSAFDKGVAQAIVTSQPYKAAIKLGLSPQEAAKKALENNAIRDRAIRYGNVVTNHTQFGANFALKPEFFRKDGTIFGVPLKWIQQYHRFPIGMMSHTASILNTNDARALDILRRGNPAETSIVDFKYGAEAFRNAADDLLKAVKNGEVTDVSLEQAQGYRNALDTLVKQYNDELKKVSEIRGPKTAKEMSKMWATAAVIQYIFNGGGGAGNAIMYSAPINLPTRENNPAIGIVVPSSPFNQYGGIRQDKALNMVPGVGLANSRYNDLQRFSQALTGDNQQ